MKFLPIAIVALASALSASAEQAETLMHHLRQITFSGKRAGEGYFGADGKKMIFQSEREEGNPFFQIYLLDLESGETNRVSPGVGKTTCAWLHPNGKQVIFASTHADPEAKAKQEKELEDRKTGKQKRYAWDYDENYDIWQARVDGGGLKNITNARGYDAEAGMSPDGQWIVFASNRHAYAEELPAPEKARLEKHKQYFMEIYKMRADGSEVTRLTNTNGYDGGPFFSGDGKQICWRRFNEEEDRAEIFVMNADGTAQRQVTKMDAMSWAPFFHPSGKYLVFTTNKHGFDNFELYLVAADGSGEPLRVTTTDGFDGLASFSPDGTKLTWTSGRSADKTSQIFLADWDHAAALKSLAITADAAPAVAAAPATAAEIKPEDMRQHVEYLASDALKGRLTGTEGEKLATQYAADFFTKLGLQPAAPDGSFFHPFEFTAGVALGKGNTFEWNDQGEPVETAWMPLTFSSSGSVEAAPVAFAGYGLQVPAEGKDAEYDSYVHLDVKGKWVVVLRYMPEGLTPAERVRFSRPGALRTKAMIAREKGAVGLIIVSGPTSKVRQQLVPMTFDASLAGSGIAAVSVVDDVVAKWMKAAGKDFQTVQAELDKGQPVQGFEIPDLKIKATIDVAQQKQTGRNVLAKLSADSTDKLPAVLLGAHIDHLGMGQGGTSLAAESDGSKIHHGADDNASGVAGVFEIAEWLMEAKRSGQWKPKRDVYFGLWSGEELGILGSNAYVKDLTRIEGKNETAKLDGTFVAAFNMDMIGRFSKQLVVQGLGSSPYWKTALEKRNVAVGLPIAAQDDCFLPTDATVFYMRGIPIFNLFTGNHPDYHKPSDTADKLDYASAAKISTLAGLLMKDIASSEDPIPYVEVKQKVEGQRSGFRIYLGTIPDYAQGNEAGVKLGGVAPGGPAAKAGLQAGDVIIRLAGKELKNIYEYTDVMGVLKVGETIDVTVKRGSEEKTMKITPGSRD